MVMAANVAAFALELLCATGVRRRPPHRTLREHCIAHLIGMVESRGVTFDPRIETVGLELITSGAPVLVATTHVHAGLSRVILRVLHDRNVAYEIVAGAASFPVCGAAREVRCIQPGGAFLLTIRKHLRAPGLVLAMLDSAEQVTRASVPIETDEGTFWISDPILRLAQKTGAQIVFMRGSLRKDTIVVEFQRAASSSAEELARALGAFATGRRPGASGGWGHGPRPR
jgi:hypothetical protein